MFGTRPYRSRREVQPQSTKGATAVGIRHECGHAKLHACLGITLCNLAGNGVYVEQNGNLFWHVLYMYSHTSQIHVQCSPQECF